MTARSLLRAVSLKTPAQTRGPFAIVRPLSALGLDLDPFLMIDWARGSEDPFGPHPHAGFSSVTWLLPTSTGSVRNRDSLGDDSVFHPGELHWFEAAHGAVHNETPVNGEIQLLQIFVNLPLSQKHEAPRTYRATVDTIPVVTVDDARVRVVVGRFGEALSVVPRTPEVGLLHVELDGTVRLPLPKEHNAAAIVTSGDVRANDTEGNVFGFAHDGDHVELSGRGHVVVLHGRPLQEPVFAGGPFVMGSRADLQDAIRRYHGGAMGHVKPL
jgi:redox-sensitive bicupin YhaK (pirin superfamily)